MHGSFFRLSLSRRAHFFFSPCVLPVIPAYFSFLVGSSLDREVSRKALLLQSLLFVAGFSVVFILLGISASALGRLIGSYKPILTRVGGALVLLFGLHMLGILKIRWLRINDSFSSFCLACG